MSVARGERNRRRAQRRDGRPLLVHWIDAAAPRPPLDPMPQLPEPLLRALAAGDTVVTPNRRLARALVALFDRSEREAGRLAWTAARVLPWDAWLVTLWQEALAAGAAPEGIRLRTPMQAAHAWRRIVAADTTPLVDPDGAAELAADAWSTVRAWGEGGESWRGWSDDDDDRAAFARWASRYARELDADGAVDGAQLGDRLGAWAERMPALRGAAIVLAGFVELSPQQERLASALVGAGAAITRMATLPTVAGRVRHASGASPADEIARALAWARERSLADPGATIGIAVADLAARRDEIRARAEDLLCPALQWPGREDAPRPYNLSLGAPLASAPPVAVALDLLAWADAPLPLGRAAAALRSPYVGAAEAWLRRAQLEADWLTEGRRTVSLRAAQRALGRVDRTLAEQWAFAIERAAPPGTASPREHAAAWRAWLDALGWPGRRSQDSAEHQALRAWDRELSDFTTLGVLEPRLARSAALAVLRSHLASVVFQPEAPRAPIQIVGLLEAAGQPFDALWVAGLAAETWPPAPAPHPLLPVTWQRLRNVPRSSAPRELAYARALTHGFACAAPEVVFSHPAARDDHACSPSPLVPPADDAPPDVAPARGTAREQFADPAQVEAVEDDLAPRLPVPMRISGGARLLEAQSDCPFKAMAFHRLAAEPWPAPVDGLSALERGTLVHAALAAFWRELGTQRALAELSEDALRAKAAAAAESAREALPAARWRSVVRVIAAGEASRIAALIAGWLDAHERQRPPFAVVGIEKGLPLDLHGLLVSLRLDRVDALEDGGVAIIDYKTGRTRRPETWFGPRPQAPQLALYALAHRAATPGQRVRAVAYAQLKTGELGVRGLAADEEAWRPPLTLPPEVKGACLADWPAAEVSWAEALAGLAGEIVAGLATVTPRDPRTTCPHCGLQPFCRIGAAGLRAHGDDDE